MQPDADSKIAASLPVAERASVWRPKPHGFGHVFPSRWSGSRRMESRPRIPNLSPRHEGAKVLSAIASIALALAGCKGGADAGDQTSSKYHCPMHPTYVSEQPGDCPICNMKLVPIKGDAAPADHGTHCCAAETGRTAIFLSPEKRQMIGLQTSTVERRALSRIIRTTAVVEHDETRFARIAPRFNGWVKTLHVDFTGAPVEKGQPLFTVYSPDLLVTENEYLLALRQHQKLESGPDDERRRDARRLLDAARRRLELWEVGAEELAVIGQRGTATDELLFRAPFSGHVITKTAVEGKAFMAGETLYEIGDLSHLWLRAALFEFEMPLVKEGVDAMVEFPYLGNRPFPTKVTFIYPHIDRMTRRGEVRLELDNPGHLLRPDMWANVEIRVPLGEKLSIPASAVIDTGTRHVAFVARDDGHLEPREIEIGSRTDDHYEVIGGAKEGESVVTRALFLVDSESQLKAAISGMGAPAEHKH